MESTTRPRVVLITGASGNLGSAIVRAFLRDGASLVLPDRGVGRLARLFPELADAPDHLLIDGIDLANERAVDAAVGAALHRFGRVDVVVNTVGAWRGGSPTHLAPLSDWTEMHEANVLPVLVVCRAIAPVFLAQKSGRVVNVSSRGALQGEAGSAAYAAAKSAVLRLTEAFSAELRSVGVNVNAILPSTIDTPQNRAAMPSADHTRWVAPEAVSDVVCFLASDAARAIHGASIPVYGLA